MALSHNEFVANISEFLSAPLSICVVQGKTGASMKLKLTNYALSDNSRQKCFDAFKQYLWKCAYHMMRCININTSTIWLGK